MVAAVVAVRVVSRKLRRSPPILIALQPEWANFPLLRKSKITPCLLGLGELPIRKPREPENRFVIPIVIP
jgi:hypothetical protein